METNTKKGIFFAVLAGAWLASQDKHFVPEAHVGWAVWIFPK